MAQDYLRHALMVYNMSEEKNIFDNSWEAVWQREINELTEKLKRSEFYSASEIKHLTARKESLEKALSERKNKNNKNAFVNAKQNVINQADANTAMMAQMAGDRAA